MTSRSPPTNHYIHDLVSKAGHSTPGTAHNDKASTVGSFSPWSEARASNVASSVRTTPGLNTYRCPSVGPDGVVYHPLDASAIRSRHRGVEVAEHPSPCAHMPKQHHRQQQPGGLVKSGQRREITLSSLKLEDLLLLPGTTDDIRPLFGHGIRHASTETINPAAPVQGILNSPGFGASLNPQDRTSEESVSGCSSGIVKDAAATPIFFQPMSSIMSTDSPGQPNLDALSGMDFSQDLSHLPVNSLDQLTAAMQQVGLSSIRDDPNDAEVGPVARIRRHFSPHYQGDIYLPANQSEDIADDLNCSLFIVNLPPVLTTRELLAAIHKLGPLGRIFAIHINDPELQRNHPGCAAKVVFFKREAAQTFFTQCELNGFRLKGCNARVMWNRIKTSEKPHLANSDASRVLLIGGPPSIVNSSTLTDFFHTKLEFQIDSVITHVQGSLGKEDAVIEYRFGSFRCQAQAAKMALARELPHIRCFFGKDPMEPEAYRPFEYFSFLENI